jgi:hypothetical protein
MVMDKDLHSMVLDVIKHAHFMYPRLTTAAIERMLNLNTDKDEDSKSSEDGIWKVLVFDSHGRDIISSVLRVNDLFKNGVTVHMLISAERYPIPDVPAIYFVTPTAENIQIIAKDLANGLYESTYLNFTSPISRDLLEDLANRTMHTSSKITQVYDQYLNFIVSEPNIYSLGMPRVYSKLNNPKISEDEIQALVHDIVNGLFSVVLTSGSIPIIRSTRGNAAEMVAQKLDEKLRNHVLNTRGGNYRSAMDTGSRPVLIILDRNVDLVSMLAHSWTYESLVNDVCSLNKNRITVESVEDGNTTRKSYDLDPTDFFWNKNARLPFPEVAENLDAALNKYRADAQGLTGQTGLTDINDLSQLNAASNAQQLKAAVTALPELTARKQTIDMHMNIATTILNAIGSRGLADFFEVEEAPGKTSKAEFLKRINNPEFKNPNDKLRAYIVYFLHTDVTATDQAEFEKALTEKGADLAALKYIKRVKELTKMTIMATQQQQQQNAPPGQSSDFFKGFSGLTSRITDRLKDGKLSEGFGSLISGVRNLLPASKDLPITKVVESVLEPPSTASAAVTDDYLYFDPRATRGSLSRPPKRNTYEEAVIFTVGGGNFSEYGNLQDWVARTTCVKRVSYGSTDICSPATFLAECSELGSM